MLHGSIPFITNELDLNTWPGPPFTNRPYCAEARSRPAFGRVSIVSMQCRRMVPGARWS